MYSFYLYFPIGSNQDGFGRSGLMHLVEHYLILSLKEKMKEDYSIKILGQTGHEHMIFNWQENSFENTLVKSFLSLIKEIKDGYTLINKNILSRAKREVIQEIYMRKYSIKRYDKILSLVEDKKLVSPIGKKESINDIKDIDISNALDSFPKARLYIYNWNDECFYNIDLFKSGKSCKTEQSNCKFSNFINFKKSSLEIGKNRLKILIPAKMTVAKDEREMIKNGTIRDFFISIIYDRILSYFTNVIEIKHSKFIINDKKGFCQFDFQINGDALNTSINLSKKYDISKFINEESFLDMKRALINKLEFTEDLSLLEDDIYNEIMNIEFFNEKTLSNDKNDAFDIINHITFEDMTNFINTQFREDEIWIFEGE